MNESELCTDGFYCYNNTDESVTDLDPNKITYFVHPKSREKYNVLSKKEVDCLCCFCHRTTMFFLEDNHRVFFCNKMKWMFLIDK